MKRLIPAVAILLGWAVAAWSATPATLTTLKQIHALTNAEASKGLPVAFEATVTYARAFARTSFMQDGDAAIFVLIPQDAKLKPGDRVLVRGTTRPSFRPIVVSESITLLHHGALPDPVSTSYDELIQSQHDAMRVTVHAVVRTVDFMSSKGQSIFLRMIADDGYIDALVEGSDANMLKDLLDAEVEVTGVAAGSFDNKMQMTGIQLHVSSMADVKILKRAGTSPWNLPATPMDTIVTGYRLHDLAARVRVHGTITYYQPGSAVVLQDGAKSLWIGTRTFNDLKIGDLADAIGFPEVRDGFLTLARSEVEDDHVRAPIVPLPSSWQSLTLNDTNNFGHVYDLVSIEGRVVTETREALQDQYVLMSDGHLTTAIYRRSDEAGPAQAMKMIPLGSEVRVSGICVLENSNPFNGPVPFDILLRSTDDITVVAKPSLLNIRNLVIVVGLLLVVVALVGAKGWSAERKLRQKTAALAMRIEKEASIERSSALLEQKRSRILEDINGSQPLASILEKIVKMVSFCLDDAPCWCEVANGSMVGNCPSEPHNLRIVRVSVDSHAGLALGALFAALAPQTPPSTLETDALSGGARLATLAIETRRLYSDLRHRSEFDLLTDIHNRFSLHKRLDVLIQEAGPSGIFGIIYVDLDKFKPINDNFGHHVGDVYLQEVARRMNDKLLGCDMLARLGGDEFAALVSLQHGRSDLNKIVARLESCFDAPFIIEGHVIKGSASIGKAVYPEDGVTNDDLLNAADASMYVVKNSRSQSTNGPSQRLNPELSQKDRG
jgi:diguanylate cyclase (GGDEF)-like protein